MRAAVFIFLNLLWSVTASAEPPLTIETKIPLGDVRGRIDHLAIDVARQRLFVAELGNDAVGVIDLPAHKLLQTLVGLDNPQGVAYMEANDTLYVANGGDGTLHAFRGPDLAAAPLIKIGSDADNVRVDADRNQIYVGYGNGALAIVDAGLHKKVADIALRSHPEGFQLQGSGEHIFVNVPNGHEIAVVDRQARKQVAAWPTKHLHENFPMALDAAEKRVFTVFRLPATLAIFNIDTGALVASGPTCGDADDVFFDAKRRRIYVICGEGYVDAFAADGALSHLGRAPTASGARTAIFVPTLDRLFVAVRKTSAEPAAVWVLRYSER